MQAVQSFNSALVKMLPGAGPDGVCVIDLEKKYEGTFKMFEPWQKRRFFFMPDGEPGAPQPFPALVWCDQWGESLQKAPVHLNKCTRITTSNRARCHVELHGCYHKLIQLRAPDPESWAGLHRQGGQGFF